VTSSAGPSPAEQYAAARRRQAQEQAARSQPLTAFRSRYEFDLDDFQIEACTALQEGRGVLVAAPTGSGKTVVGEFAVHLALATGRKAFYTTPIKALSNQKYADLVAQHGPEAVGLLTGDTSVNGDAQVVVMTTEVLRNMLYAESPALRDLGYVVMDEVHYLADRFRGAVWEEVIIHLPDDVLVVSLSATVSNAEEFGAWLDTVRGNTEVVVSEHRPVPLWQHVMAGRQIYDLFTEDEVNPELVGLAREVNRRDWAAASTRPGRARNRIPSKGAGRNGGRGAGPQRGGRGHGGGPSTSRPEVIATLDAAGLLPVISFIFSRAGCDAAVTQCLQAGVRLTTPAERDEIRTIVEARCEGIGEEDLTVLGYWEWAAALERGVAAHHAGMLPTFKEVVEELFTRGLVKAVFATETLSLGINMPARSVVLEKLVKWNGETHADITPGEYTQLTGRAGRRGIDVEGHAVVLWHPGLDPEAVGGLASTRTYQLRSSFRPTYNMAVNLVDQVGRSRAREILETSFAQFQADRAVVGLARQARKQEEALEGYAAAMRCHLGDFHEYARLRQRIGDRETSLSRSASRDRRAEAIDSLERLRRGDIFRVPGGRRPGWAVVLDPGVAGGIEGPRPSVLTVERQVRRLTMLDIPEPVEVSARITVPKNFNGRDAAARRDLASSVRSALGVQVEAGSLTPPTRSRRRSSAADDEELSQLRRQLRTHPCHGCADREDHARWAERWWRLRRETETLTRRIEGRTNTIARVFDRVCEVLTARGYLLGDQVTPDGQHLRRLYSESDLLVAECLRAGVWRGLDPPSLAACVSAVVYESRRDDTGAAPRVPRGGAAACLQEMIRIWSVLDDDEREHRLDVTPEPDLGLAWPIHRWAAGQPLEAVLRDADLAAGDFVRWCKQVVDLLGQISIASDDPQVAATARTAASAVSRGVVATIPRGA
jgi:ATP-dependent RNA helicase HelY